MARPNIYVEFCFLCGVHQEDIHDTLIRLLKAYKVTLFHPYAAITTGPGGEDYELENADESMSLDDVFEWIAKHSGYGGGAINFLWSGLEYRDLGVYYELAEHPEGLRWHLSLQFNERSFEEGEEPFCEDVTQLAKEITCALPIDFAVAGDEAWFGFWGTPYRNEFQFSEKNRILYEIPGVKPGEGPPPWFYILNKERYELSKPYLFNLPFKLIEELPNGCVYLFVDYPVSHDDIRRRKAEGEYNPEFIREFNYQPLTERGRAPFLMVLTKVQKALEEEVKRYSEEVPAFREGEGEIENLLQLVSILQRRSCIEGYLRRLREHGTGWLREEVMQQLRTTDWLLQLIAFNLVPKFWKDMKKERKGRSREEWWWYLDEVLKNPNGEAAQAAKKAVGEEHFMWE